MTLFFSILLTGILTDNFVLSRFLGICPFLGVSKKLNTAVGMSVAVTFVMLLATAVYVALGFTRNAWSTAWWVFPVGGILCGAVSVALNPYKGEDD